jgi:homoserine kinase type II
MTPYPPVGVLAASRVWLTRRVITEPVLLSCLSRHWDLQGVQATAHDGGMGSQTWFIDLGDHRWVAKAVAPGDGRQLAGGLAIANRLDQKGIPAGSAVPAASGLLAIDVGDAWVALLTWVPGNALTGQDDAEQHLIGRTLAQVHQALAGYRVPQAQHFHWVDPAAGHLTLRPWVRPAITAALSDLDAARPDAMTWGLLHADPAPEAFRLNPATGRCGVIDWSYALYGPLLYDLASAVMYAGGPEHAQALIQSYLGEHILTAMEVEHGLAPMLRFRWAVQANYFAWRIAENNLTGISNLEDNEKGLEDARRFLTH